MDAVTKVIKGLVYPALQALGLRRAPAVPPEMPAAEPEPPAGPLPEAESVPAAEPPQEVTCRAVMRPDLSLVNIRSGPGLSFSRVRRAAGGTVMEAAGRSVPDAEGFAWVYVRWDGGDGWARADTVSLPDACGTLPELPLTPPAEPGAESIGDEPD